MPDGATPLRKLLGDLNWSPEQLINRVNVRRIRRGSAPLHAKTAYPWQRGGRPSADSMCDVIAVLSERLGRTLTPADFGWNVPRPSRARHPLDVPCEAPWEDVVREAQEGASMERRSFVLLSGAAATAPALALLMGATSPLKAAIGGDRVSAKLVEGIERSVREVRSLDDSNGSAPSLLWAHGLWQSLARVITKSSYGDREGRRLHCAYVEMCETYGWMLYDSGHHPQAQRVYQCGQILANRAASHPELNQAVSNLLASAAYQASWLNQHRDAETLLNVATQRCGDALTPRLRAVIASREIFAAGRRGDFEQAKRAADGAHDALDVSTDEGPWWSAWLSHASIDSTTGRACLSASPGDAEALLSKSVTVDRSKYPRDWMLAETDLGEARRLAGDVDGAVEAAQKALEVAESITSRRVHERLDALVGNLRAEHPRHRAVRALDERGTKA